MIREFYANWATKFQSHFVKVRGVDVILTPAVLNEIIGTSPDADPLVLTGLNIRPPYRAIQHTLCGPQSMVQWSRHSGKRYGTLQKMDMNTRRVNVRRMEEEIVNEGVPPQGPQDAQVPEVPNDVGAMTNVEIRTTFLTLTQVYACDEMAYWLPNVVLSLLKLEKVVPPMII
uniref:Uncharacterized protein n=1 Tax=Solanum tuberosum TaxID=4113 RepID=M1DF52_SOLTU